MGPPNDLVEDPVVKSPQVPYLRLHVEEEPQLNDAVTTLPGMSDLMESFEATTGWKLAFHETSASHSARTASPEAAQLPARGKLIIDDMSASWPAGRPTAHRQRCESLVDSINLMCEQLAVTREALWRREAELATSVPVIARADDSNHVAKRLETSLQAACNGVGASSAALYVLDDATSKLKLRACWGMPQHKLLEPARPLQGALADLEALLGHAIVLEDCPSTPHWETPEPAASAVCVPVSSATTPLGTLWVFDQERRDYSSQETNLIEIVAGRIAAELEREAALAAGQNANANERELEQAGLWQQARLTHVAPLIDQFDIAGFTRSAGTVGGDFHWWTVHNDGRLAMMVGDVQAPMVEAGLGAATLSSLAQTHAEYQTAPAQLITRVGESLWTGSAGDLFASLAYATLDPASRELLVAGAGSVAGMLIGPKRYETLIEELPPLGGDPDMYYHQRSRRLSPGEWLVLLTDSVLMRLAERGIAKNDKDLARLIRRAGELSAQQMVDQLTNWLQIDLEPLPRYDLSMLVVSSH